MKEQIIEASRQILVEFVILKKDAAEETDISL
jgi:hypothetical protein